MNKKYSLLVETMLENVTIATLVMEALESTVESPDEIEQIIDDADAMIDFIKNITRKTFFQGLPSLLQTELSEVANFLAESVREKEYLASNRLTVPENMIIDPKLVTIESVAKIFEIALCRYLTFICVFFTNVVQDHADEYNELPDERKEEVQQILLEVSEFNTFRDHDEEYLKISFEDYAKVHFVSFEDDLDAAEKEALGIESDKGYASNVASFGDGDFDTDF